MSRLSKTLSDSSVVKLLTKARAPPPPNFCLCQTEAVSVFQTETGGGGGEAVSGSSTLPWSSLDQGHELDVNMECSSSQTTQPVTLVQNRLTDSALAVSLPPLWMSFKTDIRRVEEKENGSSSFFCLKSDRSKRDSSQFWFRLFFSTSFPLWCWPLSVSLLLLPSSNQAWRMILIHRLCFSYSVFRLCFSVLVPSLLYSAAFWKNITALNPLLCPSIIASPNLSTAYCFLLHLLWD